jgi:hypothetical protein
MAAPPLVSSNSLTVVNVALQAEFTARDNPCNTRHTYGVGEKVHLTATPALSAITYRVLKADVTDIATPYDTVRDGNISGRITEIDILNGHCTNCGHIVSMSNNFMLSDYDDTITDENDDKMNFILNQCPYCGMQEVRWDNCENEKKYFPYWKEDVESEELLKNDEEEK